MAKISRRAVASSSSAAVASSSSTTRTSSSSSSSATPQSSTNNIQSSGKQTRAEHTQNYAVNINGNTPSTATPAFLDPWRGLNAGDKFTTHNMPQGSANFASTTQGYTPPPPSVSSSPPFLQNKTDQAQILAAERERIRAEFFATYDVMTGVRIAATLGGFFGLMVFLIVWKSRSSSNETMKVLKDPKMAAVAAVCMQEEEERKIQEAMVATGMSIYPDEYDTILYRRQRMLSLGNVSAPPVLHRGYRFSSVGGGGYSSLLEPPRRFSYSYGGNSGNSLLGGGAGGRRKSGSESSRILSNYPMGSSFGMDDYFMETDDELDNGEYPDNGRRLLDMDVTQNKRTDSSKGDSQGFLAVPHAVNLPGYDSRRSSAMTCCSTESSYLERRCSAFTLGLGNLPSTLQRKLSTASRTSSTDLWDYYYPDIQVIQPTPKASPCPSERSTNDQLPTCAAAATTTTMTTKSITTSTTTPTTTTTTTTTTKTAQKPTKAANGNGAFSQQPPPRTFVRKHSIAYYDPESAQAGRKQQIHSISADTVDLYPYNQTDLAVTGDTKVVSPATPGGGGIGLVSGGLHQSFHYNDSPTEELRLNVRRKIAVVELQRPTFGDNQASTPIESNNNSFPYSNSAAAIAAATAVNSSSLSMDSTPASMDKLNGGSGSIGTAKTFFNAEKRAPLASLSSFKISSLEYQDSDMRSLDEDSVFLDSVADTDEDIQQFSSESEEASLGEPDVAEPVPKVIEVTSVETPMLKFCSNETVQKHPAEKRFSLGGAPTSIRAKRPLLQRHRTISATSSDRISLIGQQLKEFSIGHFISSGGSSGTYTPTMLAESTQPLETHFGTVISTSSPPTHPRRAQLLQQYSDPQSMHTNTNTEDDTCSTQNTEVCAAVAAGSDIMTPQAHLRRSSSRCSPQTDGSIDRSVSIDNAVSPSQALPKQQLPRSRLADDPCASSISDSVITATNARQPIICVPSSLKNLILRGSSSVQVEKLVTPTEYAPNSSAVNLSRQETAESFDYGIECATCPSVMLELPLIKLPTEDSSDSSSASNDIEHSRSASDESRDPSLPGSSRKWSKETLF